MSQGYVNHCRKCKAMGFGICHCPTTTGGYQGLGGSSTATISVRFCPNCGQLIYDNALHFCPNAAPLPFSDEEPAPAPWICPVCRCGVRGDVERCPCRARERGGPLGVAPGISSLYGFYVSATTSGGGGTEDDLDDEGNEGEEAS
jgi:hypothetical protein